MTSTKAEPVGTCDVDLSAELRIKRILVPTDFTSNSRQALPYAVNLARNFGAKITLIHVVRAARSSDRGEANTLPENSRHDEEAEKDLALLAEHELEREICGGVLVMRGGPPDEIDRVAAKLRVDLIVTATHACLGIEHFAFGSTAEGIIHNAPCPVLVVPEPLVHVRFPGDDCGFKRILVPVRLTMRRSPALDYAVALARHCHSEIMLLNTMTPDRTRNRPPGAIRIVDKLERLRQRLTNAGIRTATAVSCGTPFREIAELARTERTDLIVITSGARLGLRKHFGTGTAELVMRHAPCPVLVIRRDNVSEPLEHPRKEHSMAKAV